LQTVRIDLLRSCFLADDRIALSAALDDANIFLLGLWFFHYILFGG
jgi:hypothetical protein